MYIHTININTYLQHIRIYIYTHTQHSCAMRASTVAGSNKVDKFVSNTYIHTYIYTHILIYTHIYNIYVYTYILIHDIPVQ